MSKSAAILSVRGLTRTYDTAQGGLTVLKGVDLDVYPGEIVGLIGPSGSGKSSLLHAAGLLERPTAGVVTIDGEAVGDLDEDHAVDGLEEVHLLQHPDRRDDRRGDHQARQHEAIDHLVPAR